MTQFTLQPGTLSYAQIKLLQAQPSTIILSKAAEDAIAQSVQCLQTKQSTKAVIYGVNTGFGKLASQVIPDDQLIQLQKNLLYSHAAGVGAPLDDATVALVLLFKANSLARGYSGVRAEIIERLLLFYNARCYPWMPSQGSVGASGDLAPLAHLSLALKGEGAARYENKLIDGSELLARLALPPLELHAKEGLALINGLQVSAAVAMQAIILSEQAIAWSVIAGSLTMEALRASLDPFDAQIQACRNLATQAEIAAQFRLTLQGSQFVKTGPSLRMQDPYSIRCQPQVLGAIAHAFEYAQQICVNEANAVSDNPLVFSASQQILSGGNFHGEALSMAADHLALAIAEMGSLSERRTALLVDAHMSGLSPFLADNAGVQSGFMIAHVTASALACENKTRAHPVSIESLPTSANQEDHVSHAAWSARRLLKMLENLQAILAIEVLAALQGCEQHAGLMHADRLQKVVQDIRNDIPPYADDRPIHQDIEKVIAYMKMNSPVKSPSM